MTKQPENFENLNKANDLQRGKNNIPDSNQVYQNRNSGTKPQDNAGKSKKK